MPLPERAGLKWLWPQSLFGQLLLIMVCGTLAIQLLSSSIWFDVRFARVLEAPTRLAAVRAASLIEQGCVPGQKTQQPHGYQVRCLHAQPLAEINDRGGHRRVELLLRQALASELGHELPLTLLEARLTDEHEQPIVWRSLFGLSTARAHIRFAVPVEEGRWLEIDGHEQQGWSGESAWALIADYVLRVYALRIFAVLLICWLAVRLCLRPLQRLSEAARGLGDNLEQPPLPLNGPLEVREATHTFNVMQQRLIAMLREQTYFLTAVSHDLRTPLTRMRLRVEMLADKSQRERLVQNIAQMDAMIAQVLDLQHCGEPSAVEPVDLNLLLQCLCGELATAVETLPIVGQVQPIQANPVLLQRCLQNLLENALRYARDISVLLEQDEHNVQIHVDDHGPGIDKTLLGSITEPFVRGDSSRNHKSGGYGLGLSIAKRIAVGHGGSLTLKNRDSGGLRATLKLPKEVRC